jgi:fatty acid-binding protein DegV
LFLLESLNNLANNGRVNRAVAVVAGILGIRLLGRAKEGVIDPVAKPRGYKKALEATFAEMENLGYCGGKLRISYNENETAARALCDMVRAKYPAANVEYYPARALCSFYAERGGIILGFEIKKN